MALTIDQLWDEAGFSPNASQFEAINHVEGPLFLPAGPGSGKTRVLLWRTVNLIVFHGVEPHEIFLSTFTEKAAFQLKQGLQSLLGLVTNHTNQPYDLSGMFIGTVHSLCQRLITDRKYSPDKTRPRRPHVLDALSQYFHVSRFLREALPEYEFDHKTINRLFPRGNFVSESRNDAINNAISVFNRFSEDCLIADDHLGTADELVVPVLRLYKDYRSSLVTNSGVMTDFSLLQAEALDLLECHPESGSFFKHVIVDEYQDTNTIQERIFFKLAAQSKNLCVVGDDEQALYRFRGATVENFVEFPERCREHFAISPREIPLNVNYRSRKRIVDFYTQFMGCENWSKPQGGSYRLEGKNIQAHSNDASVSVVATTQGERTLVNSEITSLVTDLIEKGKVQDLNQIAFLFPSLKTEAVKSMKASLEAAGHLVYAPRAGRFLEVDESIDVFGLFAEILDPPEKSGDFGGKDYDDFHEWIDTSAARARVLMREDANLKRFVADRRAEVETAAKDYELLLKRVEKEGWNIDDIFVPETMKKVLLQTSGISEKARRSLGNAYFERIIRKRIEEGDPFRLGYVMNAASSLDWNVLDLFYRLIGFDHFKRMLDLAESGDDEGPTCNLALISGYLARYLDEFTSILTGRALSGGFIGRTFYLSYLYAIFRSGESEYEDADDPFPRGRIPFLTIHQSKGLEFPVVVIPSLSKKHFGPQPMERIMRGLLGNEGEPLDRISRFDIMRMFYVALSRAENLLVLGNPRGRGISTDPAFKSMLEKFNPTRIPDFDVSSMPEAEIGNNEIPRNYSYTADYLLYQKCPRQYMFFRRYGFVPSRSQTMFFGSLVHQTLEDLHQFIINRRKEATA